MAIHLVLDPPLNEMRLVFFLKSDLWVDKRSVPNYNKSEIKLGTELYKKRNEECVMSHLTDQLMKQLRFISEAGNAFLSQRKQRLSGQQRVLAILKLEDGLVQNYLAEVLDLRPSSLAELLKKMENSGDIERKEDEADKRIKRIYLTDAGRSKAEKLSTNKEEASSEIFFAGLTEEEQQLFSDYLQKIATGWEADFQQQAERFVDPMDRLQAMQHLRESMMDHWGGDWQSMSNEERRQMKKEMKDAMRQMPFRGHHGMPGFPPFGRGGRNDFHHPWQGDFFNNDSFDPRKQKPKGSDSEHPNDEWKDF